jgi:hypothetical protein
MGFFNAFKAKSPKETDVSEDNTEHKAENKTEDATDEKNELRDIETHSEIGGKTSKPSSEKDSTLVDVPLGNSTGNDGPEKELSRNGSPTPVQTEESHEDSKEVAPKAASKAASDKQSTKEEKTEDVDADTPADEEDYPKSWRLALITVALCLCVFCVALVCTTLLHTLIFDNYIKLTPTTRITQSSQQQSRRSQINSIPSRTWVGTEVRIS